MGGRHAAGGSVGSLESTWRYDKTDDITVRQNPVFWRVFDYALVEVGGEDERALMVHDGEEKEEGSGDHWSVISVVDGFAGLRLTRPGDEGTVKGGRDGDEDGDGAAFVQARDILRRYVTRGWWVDVNMEPKIKILKHWKKT